LSYQAVSRHLKTRNLKGWRVFYCPTPKPKRADAQASCSYLSC
jgi:hypothetical protein